jgi:hypothetical protein
VFEPLAKEFYFNSILINEISEELVIFVKHQFGLKSEVSF